MSDANNRLERALKVWLEFRSNGEPDSGALLRSHPELSDLLEPLVDAAADDGDGESESRVLGGFALGREIGRGGMGIVYEARQLNLDRRVALKVLYPHLTAQPDTVVRFQREARALASLDHSDIVAVYGFGDDAGCYWLAMELIDGVPLDLRIAAMRRGGGHAGGSLQSMVRLVERTALALEYAHAHGVVHRDVKPANIFLRADDTPVLGDFGLARGGDVPTVTAPGGLAGTPDYMAPERLQRGVADQRGDVFSLGVTLYEALTLQRPFAAATTEGVMHRILTAEPEDPGRVQRGLPPELVAIVFKAMEKDPARRYQSAGAFAEDLRAFLELRPVQARRASSVHRLRRWVRRRPLLAALLAVLAISVPTIAGLTGYLLAERPTLAAGARKLREDRIVQALASGFSQAFAHRADPAFRSTFAEVLRLDPDRTEAVVGLLFGEKALSGSAAALALLEAQPAALQGRRAVRRLQAALLRGVGRGAEADALLTELGAPQDALDHSVAAMADAQRAVDSGDREGIKAAVAALGASERLWPEHNVAHLILWATAARAAGDAAAQLDCAHTLVAHFSHLAPACATVQNLLRLAEPQAALAAALRGVELQPDNATWRFNLAQIYLDCGRDAEALCELDRAIALAPDYAVALGQRGTALAKLGRPLEARDVLEQAVALDATDGAAWYNLGAVYHQLHDASGALAAMRRAVELLPEESRAHESLCKLLRVAGLADELAAEESRWRAR